MLDTEYRKEICPIQRISRAILATGPTYCTGTTCAWWDRDKECCAILTIAKRLDERDSD